MPRTVPDSSDTAPGYALLLWVDLPTGRRNGFETIFVPLVLAEALSAARRELHSKSSRASTRVASAWPRSFTAASVDSDCLAAKVGRCFLRSAPPFRADWGWAETPLDNASAGAGACRRETRPAG